MRYNEDIFYLKEKNNNYEIDKDILNNISVISHKVNSPEYTKSPIFVKNKKNNRYHNKNNYSNDNLDINNWKLTKNFKDTIQYFNEWLEW